MYARRKGDPSPPVCPDCAQPILEGDGCEFDHEIALIDGGKHAEHNIRGKHRRCHKQKTARETLQRAEKRAHAKRAYDIKKPRHSLSHPRFKKRMDGTVVDRTTGEPV